MLFKSDIKSLGILYFKGFDISQMKRYVGKYQRKYHRSYHKIIAGEMLKPVWRCRELWKNWREAEVWEVRGIDGKKL